MIKYLAAQRNIEIAFAPVAGTRILVPFRMTIPTPLGTAVLEATQFITTAHAAAGREDAVSVVHVCPGERSDRVSDPGEGFSPSAVAPRALTRLIASQSRRPLPDRER